MVKCNPAKTFLEEWQRPSVRAAGGHLGLLRMGDNRAIIGQRCIRAAACPGRLSPRLKVLAGTEKPRRNHVLQEARSKPGRPSP